MERSLPGLRRGPPERLAAWLYTGPLGHFYGVVVEVVVCSVVVCAGACLGWLVVCDWLGCVAVPLEGAVCVLSCFFACRPAWPPKKGVLRCVATDPPNTSSGTVSTIAAIANAMAAVTIATFMCTLRGRLEVL